MGLHSKTVTGHDDRGFGWLVHLTMTTVDMELYVLKEAFCIPLGAAWASTGKSER